MLKRVCFARNLVRHMSVFTSKNDEVFKFVDKRNEIVSKNNLVKHDKLHMYCGISMENLKEMGDVVYKNVNFEKDNIISYDDEVVEIETVKNVFSVISPVDGCFNDHNEKFIEKYDTYDDVEQIKDDEYVADNNVYLFKLDLEKHEILNFIDRINEYNEKK